MNLCEWALCFLLLGRGVMCGMVLFEKRLMGSVGWEEKRWPKSHNTSDLLMTLNPTSPQKRLISNGTNVNEDNTSKALPGDVNRFAFENVWGACCHYPAIDKRARSSLRTDWTTSYQIFFLHIVKATPALCDACDAILMHRGGPGRWIFNHAGPTDWFFMLLF